MPRIRITDEYALVKRDRSGNWYLEWRERGEKVRRSTRTADAAAARERARELILEGANIRDASPDDIAVADIVERYWLQRGKDLPSASTVKRARKLWAEFWGDRTLSEATLQRQEEFVTWMRKRGYVDNYIRRVLSVGKAAFNRAWKRGEVQRVPFVDLPPRGESYPHFATREQLVQLLNTPMPAHMLTYCLVRLGTGCRGDAALGLQPFQIDRAARLVRLNPPKRTQTKKYRPVVPLTDMLAKYLGEAIGTEYLVAWKGKPIASIRKTWNKVCQAAGLPAWFSPKILRHTVATELRRRGVPHWEAEGLLGHKTAGTTEIYAKFDPAYLGKARKALDAWARDLAKDVAILRPLTAPMRGATAGPLRRAKKNGATRESRAVVTSKVVGVTGFELATSTSRR